MKLLTLLAFAVCLQAQDYTLSSRVNPGRVYAGYPLTIELDVAFASSPSHVHPTLTTSDPSLTAALWCGMSNPKCWGSPAYIYNSSSSCRFWVIVTGSVPGSYTVTVTTTANQLEHSLELPVTILPPAGPVKAAVPPVPAAALAALQAEIANVASPNPGTARCDPAAPDKYQWSMGLEPQVWYYDGALVYWQIADYTGDPKWKACALSVASAYQAYVMSTSVPGWRVFTQGLRRTFEETQDPKYKDAVLRLSTTGSAYAASGGDPADLTIRETAYMLRAYTDAHLLGLPVDLAARDRSLNWLLGMTETLFSGPPNASGALIHQLFWDGLAGEALTYYYDQWNQDPRIPAAIKKMADWIWLYGWDDVAGKILWNPFPLNPGYPRHCDNSCGTYTTQLIGLTQPIYWWLAKVSGDDSYRVKGDRMFAHAFDLPKAWSGKELSERLHFTLYGLAHWRLN
jgi:hypothetical protein